MKRIFYAAFGSLLVVIFLFFQGCGDTNVFEGMADDSGDAARIEEAKQNLNSGNFDAVIASLENKTNRTEQEKRYLASAYIGQAGFDTLKLLEEIAKNNDDDNGNDVESFDAIAGIFGKDLTEAELGEKVELIGRALGVLGAPAAGRYLAAGSLTGGSYDTRVQGGIYAALRAILNISLAVYRQCKLTGSIPLTTAEMRNKGISQIPVFLSANMPPGLERDLLLVLDGVAALSGGSLIGQDPIYENNKNDIQREFNKFLKQIGFLYKNQTDPTDSTNLTDPDTWHVTEYELTTYLNHLLWPARFPGLPQ